MTWLIFAVLSAVFAALTSILAKVGIQGVNSNLATAIRTVVVVIMSWVMVFVTNNQTGIKNITTKSHAKNTQVDNSSNISNSLLLYTKP